MSEKFREYKLGKYSVRKAEEKDMELVHQLLCDTARWLKEKGVSQWENYLHGEGSTEVKQGILAGITYIVENSDRDLVAVFNFSDKQNDWDIDMWGVRNDLAYYLHKLAIAKGHHQQQIGRQILNWIDENLQMENGHVRLDCFADNPVLNNFYQQAGYTFVGHTDMGVDKFSLYEKAF